MEDRPIRVQPADRLSLVQEYYFSRKLKEVARLNAEGHDIISLAIGSPDMPPSPQTISRLCEVAQRPDSHGYQPTMGTPELRGAMAAFYKRWYGVTLDPASEVLPLIGSKEGILHVTLAFVNPGDGVLVPNPGYPTYSSVAKLVGAKTITYNLYEELGWQPNFDELEKLDLSGVKMMWVNYPNMPTGAPASMELYKKIIDFGRRHNILICNDNPYSFILHEKPISILSIEGAKDVAIELNSMSKAHNMAGWRFGMAASNSEIISCILRVKSNMDSGVFRPMQSAAAKALALGKEWFDEVNRTYRERQTYAFDIMDMLGCKADRKQGGLFVWGRIPDNWKSAEALSDEILHKTGIFITPGFIFGSQGERFLRISLCSKVDTLKEAIRRLKEMK